MPFVKVHISATESVPNKPLLTKNLREILVDKLQIDEKIGQVVLYETMPQYRSIHHSRSKNFVFMEILLYPGRSAEMKRSLMHGLVHEVNRMLRIDMEDINCCLIEVSQDNWYGGIRHEYPQQKETRNE